MITTERSIFLGVGAQFVIVFATMPLLDNIPRNAVSARVQTSQPHAPPSASTGYDVPFSVSSDVPYTSSVKDAMGRTITVSGVSHMTSSGVNHVEIAEPAPVPVPAGVTFGQVTETLGAVTTAKPSGWRLILHGSGFPTTGLLRLQVAGRIAPAASIVWRPTSIEFTVPPGPLSATGPVAGVFEVFVQENAVWRLLGRGGSFTILPTPPGAPRR